jgi:hypothetical protein
MIITDALVELVTAEILKRVEAGRLGAPSDAPAARKRSPLLTVGSLDALDPGVRNALEARFDFVVIDRWDCGELPKAPALLTRLGLQALTRTAAGDEGCTVEGRVLLWALLNGQRAAVLEEGLVWRRHRDAAPPTLVSIYLRCEAVLKSAGLRIVDQNRLLEALTGAIDARPGVRTELSRARGRVLTENEVRALFPASGDPGTRVLRLGAGDVLTPLARDWLAAERIPVGKD